MGRGLWWLHSWLLTLAQDTGSFSQQPLPGHCSDLGFRTSEWTPAPSFPTADVPSTAPPPWEKPWRGPWDARLSLALCPYPSLFGRPPLHLWARVFSTHTASLLRNTLSSPGSGPSLTTQCPLPRKSTASTWMSPRRQATGSRPPWCCPHGLVTHRAHCQAGLPGRVGWAGGCEL